MPRCINVLLSRKSLKVHVTAVEIDICLHIRTARDFDSYIAPGQLLICIS